VLAVGNVYGLVPVAGNSTSNVESKFKFREAMQATSSSVEPEIDSVAPPSAVAVTVYE
jgi:hypothetical protein